MLEQFLEHISKNKLFNQKDSVLLAVSGGVDSVVMVELFHRAGYGFAIAHCNFRLRGKESDDDEQFVKKLAAKYNVRFYSRHFNTEAYAKDNKLSIQIAARDLRYAWFSELLKKEKFKYIATAHHQDDSIETFFINLLRGTGIDGLTGIKAKRGNIVRPLVSVSREQIESFAKQNKVAFRQDSSNLSDDYLRNKIRHHLISLLKDLNPNFDKIMQGNLLRLSFAEHLSSTVGSEAWNSRDLKSRPH